MKDWMKKNCCIVNVDDGMSTALSDVSKWLAELVTSRHATKGQVYPDGKISSWCNFCYYIYIYIKCVGPNSILTLPMHPD